MKKWWQLHFLTMVLSLCIVTFGSSNTFAQSQEWWKQWRMQNDKGNRYEGRVPIPISGHFELLSFVGYREPFDTSVNLKVKFFLPTKVNATVLGREIQELKQYRMESKKDENLKWIAGRWNEFEPWGTEKVLDKEKIPHSNLGVVIILDKPSKHDAVLAPAIVYHSKAPESVFKYIIHLRPKKTLSSVKYFLLRLHDGRAVQLKTPSRLLSDLIGGEPFRIEINVQGISDGPVLLIIEGQNKYETDGPYREYLFYHRTQIR